jgi:hypothetical protein
MSGNLVEASTYLLVDIGQSRRSRVWNGVKGIGLMEDVAIHGQKGIGANMVMVITVIMVSTGAMETAGNI